MVEYRLATKDDIDDLVKLRMSLLCEVDKTYTEDEKVQIIESNTKYMLNSFSDGSFVSWLAVDNSKIIAISGISFYNLPPNKKCPNGKVAYISNMFTHSDYRNQGIASKLFELTVEEAKKRQCTKILLNATDMGKPIYEKYGFKVISNDMVYFT